MILVLPFELRRDSLRRWLACPAVAQKHGAVLMLLSEGWWTRSQRIRTEGEMAFEVALVDRSNVPIYIAISGKALHLNLLGFSKSCIGKKLGVDDKTVAKALRWKGTRKR